MSIYKPTHFLLVDLKKEIVIIRSTTYVDIFTAKGLELYCKKYHSILDLLINNRSKLKSNRFQYERWKERGSKRKEARKLLDMFYKCRKGLDIELIDKNYTKAIKYVKTIVSPTNEIISLVRYWLEDNTINYMSAPFEAE